jgi:hypothetical protein
MMSSIHGILADVVWPALYLEARLRSVLPITVGLVIECLALRYGFRLSWGKALLVDVVMNLVSALVGMVLIPLGGLGWEFTGGAILHQHFGVGTFSATTWVLTFIGAVIVTSLIEAGVILWPFRIPLDRRRLAILFAANGLSVGVAFASLFIHPISR